MDYIPTSLLKSCSKVFSHIIAHLANLSFSEGCFPSDFKAAQITPLLKKPGIDTNLPVNNRPISNLNNISKLLERLFLTRLQNTSHHALILSTTNLHIANITPLKHHYLPPLIISLIPLIKATLHSLYHLTWALLLTPLTITSSLTDFIRPLAFHTWH